jgi:hypothetical protein
LIIPYSIDTRSPSVVHSPEQGAMTIIASITRGLKNFSRVSGFQHAVESSMTLIAFGLSVYRVVFIAMLSLCFG